MGLIGLGKVVVDFSCGMNGHVFVFFGCLLVWTRFQSRHFDW